MRFTTVAAIALVSGMSACSSGPSPSPGGGTVTPVPVPLPTEGQARQNLSDHGYTNISALHRSATGWDGSALDGTGKPVNVHLDDFGAILIVP